MAPTPGSTRELVIKALERLDSHIQEDNRRFDEHRQAALADREDRQRLHRETNEALARWQDEQRQGRREMYGKFDDLAAAIGSVEKASAAQPGKWKGFVLNLSIIINGALAAGLGTVIWYIITKGN